MKGSRPNIVFLFPDQLRADFLSAYGADWVSTPNMDWIGANGIRYQNSFSASPICVPARTSLLTGMNALKNGATHNFHNLRPDWREAGIRLWPELLAEAGYYTSGVGKMHFYPWDERRGFQYRVICEDKRWLDIRDDYWHYLHERGLAKLHGNDHDGYHENKGAVISKIPWEHSWDRFVGREAVNFIDRFSKDGPFAMMVGFPGPHCPYDPAPQFMGEVDESKLPEAAPEVPGMHPGLRESNVAGNKRPWNGVDYAEFPDAAKKKVRHHYSALVKQIDFEVGEILDALRRNNLLDNTVVILASDHGDYLGDHNLIGKASFFESAIRVPLMICGPNIAAGQVVMDMVELRDITATMLHFAGIARPDYMDSQPLPGEGLPGNQGRDRIFGLLSDGWMNFDGRYKLHRYATGERLLFDMQSDLQEQDNLSGNADYAEIEARLDAELGAEVMQSVFASMHDRVAHNGDLSQDPMFGRQGWQRTWPHPPLPAP